MIESGAKAKPNHIVSCQMLGIQMEGQTMFPKPMNNRYCPYFFS
jgi:hypothetical protein